MDDLDRAFFHLYGKLPNFLERQQFKPHFRASRVYITEVDREALMGKAPSLNWKELREKRKAEELRYQTDERNTDPEHSDLTGPLPTTHPPSTS
jgi:hypothetical protein